MIIDCHNHVLGAALEPGHTVFRKEMARERLKAAGVLPAHRPIRDEDWAGLEDIWDEISPVRLIKDHVNSHVDRSVILAVAPSDYTSYGQRGTVDQTGYTNIPGPPSIDKANDYIASLASRYEHLIGVGAVNPVYRGVKAALAEIVRCVQSLNLQALKLYPMYDGYSIDDSDYSFPIFDTARNLDVAIMVHMGTSPARDTNIRFANPLSIDITARQFPDVPILICHAGYPWFEECLVVTSRHENVYLDVSYLISRMDISGIANFLKKAFEMGTSLSQVCWGTDYPGAGGPQELLPKFLASCRLGEEIGHVIGTKEIAGMVGGNWARFAMLDGWDENETIDTLEEILS